MNERMSERMNENPGACACVCVLTLFICYSNKKYTYQIKSVRTYTRTSGFSFISFRLMLQILRDDIAHYLDGVISFIPSLNPSR